MLQEPSYDEKKLFLKISEGNEEAFTELFKIYVPVLEPFVLGITRSPAMVDEMVQETFVRLWIGRDKLASIESPKTWIFRITSHICFTYMRRKAVEYKALEQVAEKIPAADKISFEQDLQLDEMKKLIQSAINNLPPKRKLIYRLSREQGMKIPEIAEYLNLSPNTVKNMLVTALKTIRRHLEDAGYTLPLVIMIHLF